MFQNFNGIFPLFGLETLTRPTDPTPIFLFIIRGFHFCIDSKSDSLVFYMAEIGKPLCEEEQFDSFYTSNVKALRNYIFYKFGDAEQADDVVQESFIRLWNNCAKVTLDTAKGFLFKIATNLSTSLKRSEKVHLKYTERAVKTDKNEESPEYIILEKEFMDKLTNAISSLPDKQREVFLMNRIEKKTYKEIAEISGVSVKAIEKSMHKALVKLRKTIGDI